MIDDELACQICYGNADPITHEPFENSANATEKGGWQKKDKKIMSYFAVQQTKVVATSAALKPFKPPRSSQESPIPSPSPPTTTVEKENEKPKRVVISKYFSSTVKSTEAPEEPVKTVEEEEQMVLSNVSSTDSVVNHLDNLEIKVSEKKELRKRSQSLSQDTSSNRSTTPKTSKSLSQESVTSPYFQSPLVSDTITRVGISVSARKATSSTRSSIFEKYLAKKRVGHEEPITIKTVFVNSQSDDSSDLSSQNSCFDDEEIEELQRPTKRSRPNDTESESKPNSTVGDAILIDSDDESQVEEPSNQRRTSKNLFELFMASKRKN
jgi:hypothetical protein